MTDAAVSGYVARPAGDGPHPGLVVVHEAFGLNANMRESADALAAAGYVVLAVDLFAGRNRALCLARIFGGIMLRPLDHGAVGELRESLDWLADQTDVDARRLGAVGFCMGGSLVLAMACTDDRLAAVAPFYAMTPRPAEALARACPVVGSYPGNDFTAGQGRRLEAELSRRDVPHDIRIYDGAKHSFMNDHGRSHDPAAASDAWRRMLAFLGERLGPLPPPPT